MTTAITYKKSLERVDEIEGTYKVFEGSKRLKSFWATISDFFIWLAARSLRNSLTHISTFIENAEIKTVQDAEQLHLLSIRFRNISVMIGGVDKESASSVLDKKILTELLMMGSIADNCYKVLSKKLFPVPEGIDVKELEKESEKLRDFFDDLDDNDTDHAYLKHHPNIKK